MKPLDFFISEDAFRVWLPEVDFLEKGTEDEKFNSRQMTGIMSTESLDRQGESVVSKGLDFKDFLQFGHFNDNHSQATSAIVGFPEAVQHYDDLGTINEKLKGVPGWTCKGYVIKGTRRSEEIWELAKALQNTPRRLGFSIEGKVLRRKNKIIEKAKIRNVAITNCPVNTDATWNVLAKSFSDEETAIKALSAGVGTSPGAQTNGGALRVESLDSDEKVQTYKKRKKAIERALEVEDLVKCMDIVLELRPNFSDDAAAHFVTYLFKKGGRI